MPRVAVPGLVERLKGHHARILEALDLLEDLLARGDPPLDDIAFLLDFLRRYADACHHTIEECILFEGANRAGFPLHGGPVEVMVCEHGIGRYLLRLASDALERARRGEEGAVAELRAWAREYAQLLRSHIEKEEGILFPILSSSIGEVDSLYDPERIEAETGAPGLEAGLDEIKERRGKAAG